MYKNIFKDLKEEETKNDFKEKFAKAKKSTNSIALDSFEKQKESNQVRNSVSFSIHDEIKEKLTSYCKENMINRSILVEKLIADFLESGRKA